MTGALQAPGRCPERSYRGGTRKNGLARRSESLPEQSALSESYDRPRTRGSSCTSAQPLRRAHRLCRIHAQQVTKEDGPRHHATSARLETTIACAGATEVEAIPNIKKMGFVAIINLRQAHEPGANIPAVGSGRQGRGLELRAHPVQRRGARSGRGRSLPRRGQGAREPAGVRPLRAARTAPRRCG